MKFIVTSVIYLDDVLVDSRVSFCENESLMKAVDAECRRRMDFSEENNVLTPSLSFHIRENCIIVQDTRAQAVHVVAPFINCLGS
jgi:hypothetical protein